MPFIDPIQGVIGFPNAEWTLSDRSTLTWKSLTLDFVFDFPRGDIWNGTRNTMNYFGVGKDSEVARNVTGFVFDGVTASFDNNTVSVDFANPVNGLQGNRWVL